MLDHRQSHLQTRSIPAPFSSSLRFRCPVFSTCTIRSQLASHCRAVQINRSSILISSSRAPSMLQHSFALQLELASQTTHFCMWKLPQFIVIDHVCRVCVSVKAITRSAGSITYLVKVSHEIFNFWVQSGNKCIMQLVTAECAYERHLLQKLTEAVLTLKARSWPLQNQRPRIVLLPPSPNTIMLPNACFLILSRRWNMPAAQSSD